MKTSLTSFVLLFLCHAFCSAQSSPPPKLNAISLELGKTGIIFNLTYDHRFSDKNFGVRVGAGSNFSMYLTALTVGGGGYYLVGKKRRFLELGADVHYLVIIEDSDDQRGVSFVYPDYSIRTTVPGINLGYRSYGKRTLFRIGLSASLIDSNTIPGGYISFGISF